MRTVPNTRPASRRRPDEQRVPPRERRSRLPAARMIYRHPHSRDGTMHKELSVHP